MTIRNLEHAFQPHSVAVIGASGKPGSVGDVVLRNIIEGGFEGAVWPVNPKYSSLRDITCYRRIADLPAAPDLAVIVTPPQTVPGLIAELGEKGTRAAVVITAGISAASGLRQKMLDASRPYLLRIIGPNTLGLMIPPLKLNAGFSHMAARPGHLALLSQSGAMATSLIDWAADKEIGFSQIVSLGDMADVDVGDCLDMLAADRNTRAILMYLETVTEPRKFLSAARAAARLKPVIAIKAGRHEASAKAAATHTGALSGLDRVVDAALGRAGVLRVRDLDDLFDAAETISRFRPLEASRLGIVTNGGGAGVLAVDQLVDDHGRLAELSPQTIAELDSFLPATWSHANPVDIIGDAPPERYRRAVETVGKDPNVDALLVMNCPTALASPEDAARVIAERVEHGTIAGKPVFACWLGDHSARKARQHLQRAGVASFETPSEAVKAVGFLSAWSRAQRALSRVPASRSEDTHAEQAQVRRILAEVAADGRSILTEPEAKGVIAAYGIPVPEIAVARTLEEVEAKAREVLRHAPKIVIKLLSREITHKSDIGGVMLNIGSPEAAARAASEISRRVAERAPGASLDGFAIQPMVSPRNAHELIIGLADDRIFGPVILFGAGGTAVEVMDDTAIALPPLDDVLGDDLISRTRIGRLLEGYRDRPAADRGAIRSALNAVSQLIVDFPAIKSLDINPLIADASGVVALDARIEIDPELIDEPGPNPSLAIRPYPSGWERVVRLGPENRAFCIRPVKPVDVDVFPDFLSRISPDDIRLRFMAPRKQFPKEMLHRFTQIDYDREMALIAVAEDTGEMAGISRISADPDHEAAEYAILVRTDLQGMGLGWELLSRLIDYARADGLERIEGYVLDENRKMLDMCRDFGFTITTNTEERGVSLAVLDLKA
ncbi:MAG TPA: bifunctional acetate--CoA ligase family protein/GNAT family N-acetyltransferase [Devosiaceae bacterium]